MSDLSAILESIDGEIRQGNGQSAAETLTKILQRKIPRKHRAQVAELCRRCGMAEQSIVVLHKVVNGSLSQKAAPTPQEESEYAAALERIGAVNEALRRLNTIETKHHPTALIFKASCHIAEWDYRAAIEPLENYIEHPLAKAYERFIAKVNLAACWVHEQNTVRALPLIEELMIETRNRKMKRLEGNLHEIKAQALFWKGEWDLAKEELKVAGQLLQAGDRDSLFIQKWNALIECYRNPHSSDSFLRLREVRSLAVLAGDYETIRDCDRHECILRKDPKLFHHVYYGTPHEAFRERLREEYGSIQIEDSYVWVQKSGPSPKVLDLCLTGDPQHRTKLKPGQLVHRLLLIFASDFYRPLSVVEVHNVLYPEERYNPESTPIKVYQAVTEARRWLRKNKLPLTVVESGGHYHLQAKSPCAIHCVLPGTPQGKQEIFLGLLNKFWPQETFSAKEVAEKLKVSPRQALIQLKLEVERGSLLREGNGRNTCYRIRPQITARVSGE